MSGWIQRALAETTLPQVAERLGMTVRGSSLGPCPSCSAQHRASGDNRGPISFFKTQGRWGWSCKRCGAHGDAVHLVAIHLTGDRKPSTSTREWFNEHGWGDGNPSPRGRGGEAPRSSRAAAQGPPEDPEPRKEHRPTPEAFQAFWEGCEANPSAWGDEVRSFLEGRTDPGMQIPGAIHDDGTPGGWWNPDVWERLMERDVARVVPKRSSRPKSTWPTWWPAKLDRYGKGWRFAVRAWFPDGTLANIQARHLGPADRGKSRWTDLGHGYAKGLLMAGSRGASFLRGERGAGEAVWLLEGLTDLVAAEIAILLQDLDVVCLSGTEGSFEHLAKVRWPQSITTGQVPIYICTHIDKGKGTDNAGQKYAHTAFDQLHPTGARLFRLPWEIKR